MPKYRIHVTEQIIGNAEYYHEVEADSPEEAMEIVKNNKGELEEHGWGLLDSQADTGQYRGEDPYTYDEPEEIDEDEE